MSATRRLELTLAFVVCLSAVAIDISLPAIPIILANLDAGAAYGQWIVGIYLFGYAIGQIPFGLLADRLGRLPALRLGLLLFLSASVVTVWAPNIEVLIIARFIQGLGGASASVIARAIARDVTEGDELTRLTAILVASLAIATLVAPLVGSTIVYIGDWRSVFAPSVFMGIVAVVFLVTNLEETHKADPDNQHILDQLSWSARAFRQSRESVWAAAIVGFTFLAYMGIVAGIAQVVVDAYGMSSASVGLVFSGAVAFYVVAGRIGGRIARGVGTHKVLLYGVLALLVAAICCSLILLFQPSSFWFFWWAMIPLFAGMGFVFPTATAITLEPLPNDAGFAASILGTFQVFMSVIGAGITSLFYDGSNVSMLSVVAAGCAVNTIVYFVGRPLRRS